MSSQAALADDDADCAPRPDRDDWARPLVERQLAVLSDLTESGLSVVLTLQRKIVREAADNAIGEAESLTLAFARASRAVRLAIALQSKLIKRRQQWSRDAAEHRVRRAAAEAAAETRERQGEPRDREDDRFADRLARPVDETIAHIRRELGLPPIAAPACGGGGADRPDAPSVTALRAAPPPPHAGEERAASP